MPKLNIYYSNAKGNHTEVLSNSSENDQALETKDVMYILKYLMLSEDHQYKEYGQE